MESMVFVEGKSFPWGASKIEVPQAKDGAQEEGTEVLEDLRGKYFPNVKTLDDFFKKLMIVIHRCNLWIHLYLHAHFHFP